jgi:hypothetical protein
VVPVAVRQATVEVEATVTAVDTVLATPKPVRLFRHMVSILKPLGIRAQLTLDARLRLGAGQVTSQHITPTIILRTFRRVLITLP